MALHSAPGAIQDGFQRDSTRQLLSPGCWYTFDLSINQFHCDLIGTDIPNLRGNGFRDLIARCTYFRTYVFFSIRVSVVQYLVMPGNCNRMGFESHRGDLRRFDIASSDIPLEISRQFECSKIATHKSW